MQHPGSTHFGERLAQAVRRRGNPVVVGLDPRQDRLPPPLLPKNANPASWSAAYTEFCREIIDVVAPLVPVVKPQAACFEQLGPAGMQSLADVSRYARDRDLIVIIDGKRNDIGSTAEAYADGYLGPASVWGADALTVNPYLGHDSIEPFADQAHRHGAGIFVLVKTSNPGGRQFQDLSAGGKPLYRHVADWVEQLAAASQSTGNYGAIGAVVGATYPEQLGELRSAMPHAWFLVPGFGSQGGTAADVAGAFDVDGLGAVINNSRGIIFAHSRPEYRDRFGPSAWQDAVAAATGDMIEQLKAHTSAARLRASE